ERIPFPAAARVTKPLADGRRQMRDVAHHDVALVALALPDVVEHRDGARRLYDALEPAEVRVDAGHAPITQRAVLDVSMPIQTAGVVEGRNFVPLGRGRTVFPARAGLAAILVL